MAYQYLEHEADIGILAMGKTREQAFEEGARAMFGVMVDVDKVKARKKVEVSVGADTLDTLFVEWLNALLAQKDIKGMVFSKFKVDIGEKETFTLQGEAYGDEFKPEQNFKTEVKAATYSGLKYKQVFGEHHIQCILDI
jgi:SHS2 domain-containing protein